MEDGSGPTPAYYDDDDDVALDDESGLCDNEDGVDMVRGGGGGVNDEEGAMNMILAKDRADEIADRVTLRGRSRVRRILFGFALLMSATTIIAALAGRSGGTSATTTRGGRLSLTIRPPPGGGLDLTCSIANIATEEGHGRCEGLCEGGSCCMAEGERSCFLENMDVCGMVRDVSGAAYHTAQYITFTIYELFFGGALGLCLSFSYLSSHIISSRRIRI